MPSLLICPCAQMLGCPCAIDVAQRAKIGGHEDISHVLNIAGFFKASSSRNCFNHLNKHSIKGW